MWISAEFREKVIRTFDAVATGSYTALGKGVRPITTPTPALPGSLEDKVNAHQAIGRALAGQPGFDLGVVWANVLQTVQRTTGLSTDLSARALPAATGPIGRFTPTEIGKKVGLTATKVNRHLQRLGLQQPAGDGNWELLPAGAAYGVMVPFTGENGHSKYRPLWNERAIELFRQVQ